VTSLASASGGSPLDHSLRRPPLLGCLALLAAIAVADPREGACEERPSRLAGFTEFFRSKDPIPAPLRSALDAYEQGRFFAALGSLDAVLSTRKPGYAVDDALFLRAVSLVGLGWDDLATGSLVSILETDPVSPYYVPALLELVEIHDRAARWKAVADAWGRYVDRPLRAGGKRGERVRDLLYEFGELRPATSTSTRREKSLLSAPKELAVILEGRRERPSDRLLYRSGLALLRVGRHEESLRALLTIGVESPYYPYARYAIAQDLFALGRTEDALAALVRLERYPMITQEERVLESRCRLLLATILLRSGGVDDAIAVARSIADDDPEAPPARLLITAALLEAGKPALALVYDTASVRPIVSAEAKRALAVSAAYASLGDADSAARVLRGATGRVREARVSGAELDDAVERTRGLAEASLRGRRELEQASRAHLASGLRVVLAHDGPWSFATLVRRVRAALGAGPYRELALGTKPSSSKAVSHRGSWLAYLASPRRASIEPILDRLADLDAEPRDGEASLRIVNAYLGWLEQAPSDKDLRRQVAKRAVTYVDGLRGRGVEVPPLRLDLRAALAPQAAAYRRRLSESLGALGRSRAEPVDPTEARDDVRSLLGTWVDGEIRELIEARQAELRDLEFELDVALAGTLAGTPPR
jgi:tetratricopeptide (TPR) repeat protein